MKRRSYSRLAHRPGHGVERLLGGLEARIMGRLWEKDGPVTVRDVLTALNAERDQPVAYTTVMTVMTRLAEKGLLERALVGQTYEYRVAQSRDEFLRQASRKMVDELVADFGNVAIASFLEALGLVDPKRLSELRKLVEAEERQR